jgi:hypothetical protein
MKVYKSLRMLCFAKIMVYKTSPSVNGSGLLNIKGNGLLKIVYNSFRRLLREKAS